MPAGDARHRAACEATRPGRTGPQEGWLVSHLFSRQLEVTFVEEADINLLRGARGMEFVIQLDALVGCAQVPEA